MDKYLLESLRRAKVDGFDYVEVSSDGKVIMVGPHRMNQCVYTEPDARLKVFHGMTVEGVLNNQYKYWEQVKEGTRVLVKDYNDRVYRRRYFKEYKDGKIFTYCDGMTAWTNDSVDVYEDWEEGMLATRYTEGM